MLLMTCRLPFLLKFQTFLTLQKCQITKLHHGGLHSNIYPDSVTRCLYILQPQQDSRASRTGLCLLPSSTVSADRWGQVQPLLSSLPIRSGPYHHRPTILRESSNVLQQQVVNHSFPTKLRKTVKYLEVCQQHRSHLQSGKRPQFFNPDDVNNGVWGGGDSSS